MSFLELILILISVVVFIIVLKISRDLILGQFYREIMRLEAQKYLGPEWEGTLKQECHVLSTELGILWRKLFITLVGGKV